MKRLRLIIGMALGILCAVEWAPTNGLAQSSTSGLRSETVQLTESFAPVLTVTPPLKFILTDIVATFDDSSTEIQISDDTELRLVIRPIQRPSTVPQNFVNGIVFTSNLSAKCSNCSSGSVFLTVSGRSVKK